MFSRVEKQGLVALGMGNGGTHCSGSEKNALPVVFVGMKSRKKRQTNMTGTKPVTSGQMREVKKQRGPASGKIYNNTNTVVRLEKIVPPVPARKFKIPTTILRTAADGRFEARLVTPGRMQKHGTDRAIVVAEDKLGRLKMAP